MRREGYLLGLLLGLVASGPAWAQFDLGRPPGPTTYKVFDPSNGALGLPPPVFPTTPSGGGFKFTDIIPRFPNWLGNKSTPTTQLPPQKATPAGPYLAPFQAGQKAIPAREYLRPFMYGGEYPFKR
jgi:hypothetical protein